MKGFQRNVRQISTVSFLLVSIGILLAATAGGWDITNHLLNKPESFFSPPHAALYTGVSMTLLGAIIIYLCQINLRDPESPHELHLRSARITGVRVLNFGVKFLTSLPASLKLILIGVIMLAAAGPFDFIWHSTFGLDGLLSPPHSALTIGMALCSIGAFLGILSSTAPSNKGISKHNDSNVIAEDTKNNSASLRNSGIREKCTPKLYRKDLHATFIIVGILPVWLTISGLIHMVSLPFSDTQFFNFNPDPVLAVIITTVSFPFLIALILFSAFNLANDQNLYRGFGSKPSWKERTNVDFGILSLTGLSFIAINILTSIIPNEHLLATLPFYVLNILPIIAADILLTKASSNNSNQNSNSKRENWIKYIAGAILGLIFFTIYFPLITYTYNEVLPDSQPVWPSLTSIIYFKMVNEIGIFLIPPSMIMGLLGVEFASKILALKEKRELVTSETV